MKNLLLLFILLILSAKSFARSPMEDPFRVTQEVQSNVKDYIQTVDLYDLTKELKTIKKNLGNKDIVIRDIHYYQSLEREDAENELSKIILKLREII